MNNMRERLQFYEFLNNNKYDNTKTFYDCLPDEEKIHTIALLRFIDVLSKKNKDYYDMIKSDENFFANSEAFNNKQIVKYLKNITKEELRFLVFPLREEFFNSSETNKNNITIMSHIIRKLENKDEHLAKSDAYVEDIINFAKKSKYKTYNPKEFTYGRKIFYSNYYSMLHKYLKYVGINKDIIILNQMSFNFFNKQPFKNLKSIDYISEKFLEKENNPKIICQLILTMNKRNIEWDMNKWLTFIANYNNYKDIPAGWIFELFD